MIAEDPTVGFLLIETICKNNEGYTIISRSFGKAVV